MDRGSLERWLQNIGHGGVRETVENLRVFLRCAKRVEVEGIREQADLAGLVLYAKTVRRW
jgi:hypothetical protein